VAAETAPDEGGENSGRTNPNEETAPALNTEELRQRFGDAAKNAGKKEAKSELAAFRLGDAEVSLSVAGFWKGSLQGSLGFSHGPLGTNAASPDSPILFTQEADLTLDLWILKKWFVEASVLDNQDNIAFNTYRAGYRGLAGQAVRYAGIGNTGLDFPVFPYLDLGGDSSSSFGFYGHFVGGPFNFHTLLRWDQAAREERTFVGDRERSFSYLSLRETQRGLSFVLPDSALDSEPRIYVEDEDGGLRDGHNRRWRLLGPSEYAAGRLSGLVELSQSPTGMVAVAYSKDNSRSPWEASLGAYSGGGFLGEVQNYFGARVTLAAYPHCGAENSAPGKPGSRVINGVSVLVLYEPGTFSPFERLNRYIAPSSAAEEAAIVRLPGLQRVGGFELVPFEAASVGADIPLYADIDIDIARGYFQLVREGGGDSRSPETRWPLAADYAAVYLPGKSPAAEDINIRFTNYGSAGSFVIGDDVVPGSIQVWRSGIMDPNFSYNASDGSVSLASPAGFNEIIRITYLKQSGDATAGSIAAGFGAKYHKDKSPFSADFALGVRWNLNLGETKPFTEEGVSNPGTVGVSAKTAWDFGKFKAQITAGLNFEQPDSTGMYRAAGMEGNEFFISLQFDDTFISHAPLSASPSPLFSGLSTDNRADLIYRNYRDSASLGNTIMPISWSGSRIIPGENRPYPVKDPVLTGRATVIAMDFSLEDGQWTGFQIPLGDDSGFLERAAEIEIPYRFYGFNGTPPPDFKVLVQIGSLAGEEYYFQESSALIFEKLLYDADWIDNPPSPVAPNNPPEFNTAARIARFVLNDSERLKLGNAQYMRVIVIHSGTGTVEGRVFFAPPIIRGAAFRPVIIADNTVYDAPVSGTRVISSEMPDTALRAKYRDTIDRLHPDGKTQQVLHVEWEHMDAGYSAGADGRIGSLPLSSYRVLSFFVRGPARTNGTPLQGDALRFIIGNGPGSVGNPNEQYIDAEIPLSAFQPGQWSKVSIRYQGEDQGVSVDNAAVPTARFRYRMPNLPPGADLPPGKAMYAAVFVSPQTQALPDGNFRIDEIILEESAPLYRMNAGATAEYRLPGTLLAIGKTPILADFAVSSAVESELHGDPFTAANNSGGSGDSGGGVISRSAAAISLLGVKIDGNFAFSMAQDEFNWNAGHRLSRAFGPFQAGGSFAASPAENTLEHRLTATLTGIFRAGLNAEVYRDAGRQRRKWELALGVDPPEKNKKGRQSYIPSLSIETSAVWNQANEDTEGNYARLWAQSWEPLLPDLGQAQGSRETKARIVISENTKPVGGILTVEGNTMFIRNIEATRSGNIVRFDIPLDLKKALLDIRMERGFKRHLRFSGRDVLDEAKKFGEGIMDSLPLWGVYPFYSLFSPELNSALDKGLNASPSAAIAEYTWFNDLVGISGEFPTFYNFLAFIVPATAGVNVERVLEQKMDTRLDILYVRGNLGFSAVNMFGAFGYKPLFKFYRSDEYTSALDLAIGIPSEEEISYRVQWSAGAGFRGFTGSELAFNNTATIGSSGWLETLKLDWDIPVRKSLLSGLYDWVAKLSRTQASWLTLSKLMSAPYERLYKETLELTFDHSGDYLTWAVTAGHESIVRIVGRLNFTAFAKLQCTRNDMSGILSFIGTVGTTLNVMF